MMTTVSVAFTPVTLWAQSGSAAPSDKGLYVGGTVGIYFESSEGKSGHALAGSGLVGYRLTPKWAVQVELGQTGTVYCYERVQVGGPGGTVYYREVSVSKANPPRGSICHSDPVANLDVIRRFGGGSAQPYVALGFGAGFHLGLGVQIKAGKHFTVAPAVDLSGGDEFAGIRPRIGVLIRF